MRTPYLQRVDAGSAELSWVSPADAGQSVVISATDGTRRCEPPARDDAARSRRRAPRSGWRRSRRSRPTPIYCYDVQTGGTASERLGFRTAPAAGSGATVRFLAFGDSGGGGSDQTALRDQMATVPFDFMIHTGDIAYDRGTRAEFEQNFFSAYADFLKYFPVFPASGNHEYDAEDAAPFREAFVLPENGGPEGKERWYSFDWGDVHFVALDTERTGPVQAAWLDADLTANQLPWTIVYGHRPPFSSGEHGSDGAFRTHFLPVLEEHTCRWCSTGTTTTTSGPRRRTASSTWSRAAAASACVRWARPASPPSRRGHPLRLRDRVGQRAGACTRSTGSGKEFDSLVIRR